MAGKVLAVCSSKTKGKSKKSIKKGYLVKELGLRGDVHAGTKKRQVSLLAWEAVEELGKKDLQPGSFAENITTKGIDLSRLRVGTKLEVGEAVIEVTQLGKKCPHPCDIFKRLGKCIMPRQGVFAKVLKSGRVVPGCEIRRCL